MIQIQDDFQADGASTQPITPAPMPAPAAAAPSATADKHQEIDELLRQIEELSKQLENEKKQQAAASVSNMPAEPSAPAPNAPAPATSEPVAAAPAASASPAAEEFDLDSFLKDLEKRIQEDEAQNPPAPAETAASAPPAPVVDESPTESADDFRKNRYALDGDDIAPAVVADEPAPASDAPAAPAAPDEESLQMQNIFNMLGLAQISDEEKNQFLDELEQLIWNDFVEKDLPLLLTSTEHEEAKKIMADPQKQGDAAKEALLNFLSSLIPDLEDILYQKALELKAEMFAERLKRMHTDADETMTAKLREVESLVAQNRYKSALHLLDGN